MRCSTRTIFGNQGFMNNTLWYTSPKFGGITIDFAFSLLGERRIDPSMEQPRHIGLVASYDAGPLHAAVSYANTKNDTDLAPGPGIQASNATAWTIGAAYDFKFMVLGALWEMAERDVFGGSVDSDYWRVAAMFPFGQHELHLNYGLVDADGSAGAQAVDARVQLQHHQADQGVRLLHDGGQRQRRQLRDGRLDDHLRAGHRSELLLDRRRRSPQLLSFSSESSKSGTEPDLIQGSVPEFSRPPRA